MTWSDRLRLAREWGARVAIFLVGLWFFFTIGNRYGGLDLPLAIALAGFLLFLGMRAIARALEGRK